ncbi:hypothetical protein [Salinirubrum litoreum]|uniref:Uncharacterized protein n=1 Tax=Salinirubrum litoreum TaxID=1126234 RepID=A0ABD5RDL2_9EURY|nr:hypothetical protein [Salinirubrum litoreum]
MHAGVLGRVDGDFDVVEGYWETTETEGHELTDCLDVTRVFSLPSGGMAFAGDAARQSLQHDSVRAVTPTGIEVHEETRPTTDYTEIAGVPGEFVVAGSGRGTFAFDFLAADTGTAVDRATIDLDEFLAGLPDPDPWKAGFAGATGTGVLHGADLLADAAAEDLLDRGTLNQLGVSYDDGDRRVKLSVTRSGYVEVYRPSAFETGDFLTFLRDQVVPHVH